MWETKIFKTLNAMNNWIAKHDGRVQWQQIFVNNAYGVEWRPFVKVRMCR